MNLTTILHYIEAGAAAAAVLAPTLGVIGHALAALPWYPAKVLGNVLNSISVDFGDFASAAKNAKAAMAPKSEETK